MYIGKCFAYKFSSSDLSPILAQELEIEGDHGLKGPRVGAGGGGINQIKEPFIGEDKELYLEDGLVGIGT